MNRLIGSGGKSFPLQCDYTHGRKFSSSSSVHILVSKKWPIANDKEDFHDEFTVDQLVNPISFLPTEIRESALFLHLISMD